MRTGVFRSVDVDRLKSITGGEVGRINIGDVEIIKKNAIDEAGETWLRPVSTCGKADACATRPRHTSTDD
jgi:hypothetical protein